MSPLLGEAVVSFYRMTLRRTAKAKSAICKGPSSPSKVTRSHLINIS